MRKLERGSGKGKRGQRRERAGMRKLERGSRKGRKGKRREMWGGG